MLPTLVAEPSADPALECTLAALTAFGLARFFPWAVNPIPLSGLNADAHCLLYRSVFCRRVKYLGVFFLPENPAVESEKKSVSIPQIILTSASTETLTGSRCVAVEAQGAIQEHREWGPCFRHRSPSTGDAYNLQAKE